MIWRGPHSGELEGRGSKQWAYVKGYWRAQRLPCARCGRSIDYDGPYMIMVGGRRTINRRYLVIGHVVSRALARSLGWTTEQINDLRNTQPECMDCSIRSGAIAGNRARA